MPTYGYECLDCANQFEITQSIKADPLKICERCGGPLRKRIYPVGISFKGPGFYVNDSVGKSSSAAVSTDSPAKAETPAESIPKKEEAAAPAVP